jgi:acetyltransferase-like isoleucine patch superfamily enzyme
VSGNIPGRDGLGPGCPASGPIPGERLGHLERQRGKVRARLRGVGLAATCLLPQFLKALVYRHCFGYRIGRGVRIGAAYLDCARLTIGGGARIAHGVLFLRCGEVRIGKHAAIGPANMFRGGEAVLLDDYSQILRFNVLNAIPDHDCVNPTESSFRLGYGAVVTAEHRIDFTDRVTIGRCSILGGRGSSIWTHNRRKGSPVSIGDYCYLGSEIRMAPGASIPDYCVVGLGSVVTRSLTDSYSLIAGVPARRRRALTAADDELIFGKTRPDLPDEPLPQRLPSNAPASEV